MKLAELTQGNKWITRIAAGCLAFGLLMTPALLVSCGGAPAPFIVNGPSDDQGNSPPSISISEPAANLTAGQGVSFLIRWADADTDNNATIRFELVNIDTGAIVVLVDNIDENDSAGPDEFTVPTDLIPVAQYELRGVISDGRATAEAFAINENAATPTRAVINIVPAGEGPPTVPPIITVTEPLFNQSVTQDDVLTVTVQPDAFADPAVSFDPDSDARLFVLLDLDQIPTNDDPANPEADEIIVLREQTIAAGSTAPITFDIDIDLMDVPPRPNGEPYFIRTTIDDQTNPRVHSYASGSINVVELASGLVDLAETGELIAGVRFYGFNPGANLGSSISNIGDFDADGVQDFIIAAQFGNSRNFGQVGEAYLYYGLLNRRFGGSIAANTLSQNVPGVIFEGTPVRGGDTGIGTPRTDGLTDVSFISDLSGDGRPELLFGMPHVTGAFDSMDYDPGDTGDTVPMPEEVALTFTEGTLTIQIADGQPTQQVYQGLLDTTIKSAEPSNSFSSEPELVFEDGGAGQRSWILIKFSDILDLIPDQLETIDPVTVQASVFLTVFDTGGTATVHASISNFENETNYANYAEGGGDPVADVDFEAGAFDAIDGMGIGQQEVDISALAQQLFSGLLDGQDNELRLIAVPAAGSPETRLRSTEAISPLSRPVLQLTYQRVSAMASEGCYPDSLVNNLTNTSAASADLYSYSGGMALFVVSENRDNDPRIGGATRLESTSIPLELVGQEAGWSIDVEGTPETSLCDLEGNICPRADDGMEDLRVAGARFIAGGYDEVDHLSLNQGPREGSFGQNVASMGDLNNDGFDEIVISAPRNERYLQDLEDQFGDQSTQLASTRFLGSIVVLPGNNYNLPRWREDGSTSTIPTLDQLNFPLFGSCATQDPRRFIVPSDRFEVFAEDIDDMLGDGQSAGDFNQDGLDDLLCGAPMNDRSGIQDTGAAYIIYGRNVFGDVNLSNADNSVARTPMVRIRGARAGDKIGSSVATGLDVNGDRIDDVFISSATADFGGVTRSTCGVDFNNDGVVDGNDFSPTTFASCRSSFGSEVFSDDVCKAFDYDNDRDIDADDAVVFECLEGGGVNCCNNLVDNGFVAIIFGGVFTDGDRNLDQIATTDLPGVIFYGAGALHRAGYEVSSAGDFNQDGFGDILISAPGETRLDEAGRERLGVVYLIFGGTFLTNTTWNLADVGSNELPGMVFLSPYVKGRPNEAAPSTVSFIGDINLDGFGDIAIGNPGADFIDFSFPQGPDAPTDASVGRRRDTGDTYVIYGNNFGSNRAVVP